MGVDNPDDYMVRLERLLESGDDLPDVVTYLFGEEEHAPTAPVAVPANLEGVSVEEAETAMEAAKPKARRPFFRAETSLILVGALTIGSLATAIGMLVNQPQLEVAIAAGMPEKGAADGPVAGASFSHPQGLCLDPEGNLYIADQGNHKIRKLSPEGVVSTFAGTGQEGHTDGPAAKATFTGPRDITRDEEGNFYVAEADFIRVIRPDGTVETLAGQPAEYVEEEGYVTEAGTMHSPRRYYRYFMDPERVVAKNGHVYFSDRENNLVKVVTPTGQIELVAGKLVDNLPVQGGYGAVDGPAREVGVDKPTGLVFDPAGRLVVLLSGNDTIKRVSADFAKLDTVAGTPYQSGHQDGLGKKAHFSRPADVVVDDRGNLYVADSGNGNVRKIDATGQVTTIGGSPDQVRFQAPSGLAYHAASHTLYVSDQHRIRKVMLPETP